MRCSIYWVIRGFFFLPIIAVSWYDRYFEPCMAHCMVKNPSPSLLCHSSGGLQHHSGLFLLITNSTWNRNPFSLGTQMSVACREHNSDTNNSAAMATVKCRRLQRRTKGAKRLLLLGAKPSRRQLRKSVDFWRNQIFKPDSISVSAFFHFLFFCKVSCEQVNHTNLYRIPQVGHSVKVSDWRTCQIFDALPNVFCREAFYLLKGSQSICMNEWVFCGCHVSLTAACAVNNRMHVPLHKPVYFHAYLYRVQLTVYRSHSRLLCPVIFFWRRALKNSNHKGAIIHPFPSARASRCLSALSYRHCLPRRVFGATPMTAPLRLSAGKRMNHHHGWLWTLCRGSLGFVRVHLTFSVCSFQVNLVNDLLVKLKISAKSSRAVMWNNEVLCNSVALLSALCLSRRSWVCSTLNLH